MTAAQWREWLQEALAMGKQAQTETMHHENEAAKAQARRAAWVARVAWLRAELKKAMELEGIEP